MNAFWEKEGSSHLGLVFWGRDLEWQCGWEGKNKKQKTKFCSKTITHSKWPNKQTLNAMQAVKNDTQVYTCVSFFTACECDNVTQKPLCTCELYIVWSSSL